MFESVHGTCLSLIFYFSRTYVWGYHACIYVYTIHVGPSGAKREQWIWNVTDGCELLCGYWGLNLCPLEEQLVLFTTE